MSAHAAGTASGASAAAFFDVDNTIIRGASAFHIARGLRHHGFIKGRDIVRFAVEQAKYNFRGESKEQIDDIRHEALSIVKGWSVAEMAAIGEEVYDEVLALRIFPETKALIDGHLAKGHQVWLVTASPVEIGRLIAQKIGATGALGTVAESVDGFYTGKLVGDLLHGAAKSVAVKSLALSAGIPLDDCYAYGDSLNDLPMLSTVGHPCAINPDAKLRRFARAQGWPVKEFRGRNENGRRNLARASVTGMAWVTFAVVRGIKAKVVAPFRRQVS